MREIEIHIIRDSAIKETFNSAKEIYEKFRHMNKLIKEHFYVLSLDNKNRIIHKNLVSIGSATSSICHPREVFRTAIIENAVSIIAIHNHPSGDPTPSIQDIEITKKLNKAGEIIGIELLDHLIIGDLDYHSMKANEYI